MIDALGVAIETCGVSQTEIANNIGVSEATLRGIVNKQITRISIGRVIKIAWGLNYEIHQDDDGYLLQKREGEPCMPEARWLIERQHG